MIYHRGELFYFNLILELLQNVNRANLGWFPCQEEQVEKNAKDSSGSDRGPAEGEYSLEQRDGQIAAVSDIAADTNDQDERYDCQLAGIVEINFLCHHQSNALNTDDTVQVDGKTTGDRCWDAIDCIA